MEERLERQARNEALQREVNERVASLDERADWADAEQQFEFQCECGQPGCESTVTMTLAEYERVRSERDRFAVVPGHVEEKIERVVERNERFLIVDKRDRVEHLVQ